MPEFFILDRQAIDDKLKSLIKTETSNDGWIIFYTDRHTAEQWELASYHSEYHGGGVPVLKYMLYLSSQQLIEVALTSNDMNDIVGASMELCEREKYNNEAFRDELIKKLRSIELTMLSDFEKERIKAIICNSELSDPTNRREIVGKHWIEIKEDANFFRSISEEAQEILARIGKT